MDLYPKLEQLKVEQETDSVREPEVHPETDPGVEQKTEAEMDLRAEPDTVLEAEPVLDRETDLEVDPEVDLKAQSEMDLEEDPEDWPEMGQEMDLAEHLEVVPPVALEVQPEETEVESQQDLEDRKRVPEGGPFFQRALRRMDWWVADSAAGISRRIASRNTKLFAKRPNPRRGRSSTSPRCASRAPKPRASSSTNPSAIPITIIRWLRRQQPGNPPQIVSQQRRHHRHHRHHRPMPKQQTIT